MLSAQILHCDSDSVITGDLTRSFINGMEIELHVSTPYAHHQNGQMERAMQIILDKTRTLLAACGAPRKYWNYAVSLAAYILRRSRNSTNKITPHENPH